MNYLKSLLVMIVFVSAFVVQTQRVTADETFIPLNTSIDFTGFTGTGFDSNPSAGQLDSDSWSTTGFGANVGFGGSCNSGDCARGGSTGGVSTGGIYAFDIGGGDTILGIQPGGSDFTPGTLTLRLRNTTGSAVTSVTVNYEVYEFNDQARANSLNFAYSTDGVTFTPVPALDYTTVEAIGAASWVSTPQATTINSLNIPDNGLFYIQWQGDDVSGSGSRDEYGIDDITVTSLSPTAVTLSSTTTTTATYVGIALVALLLSLAGLVLLQKRQIA